MFLLGMAACCTKMTEELLAIIIIIIMSFTSFPGSHDLLYQEFLPLLPNLLQGQHPMLPDLSSFYFWREANKWRK